MYGHFFVMHLRAKWLWSCGTLHTLIWRCWCAGFSLTLNRIYSSLTAELGSIILSSPRANAPVHSPIWIFLAARETHTSCEALLKPAREGSDSHLKRLTLKWLSHHQKGGKVGFCSNIKGELQILHVLDANSLIRCHAALWAGDVVTYLSFSLLSVSRKKDLDGANVRCMKLSPAMDLSLIFPWLFVDRGLI